MRSVTNLPANGVHATSGLVAAISANLVSAGFVFDCQSEKFDKLFFRCSIPQHGFDIHFIICKKTASDFAVGCQPQPVAGVAKMPAHRGDKADFTFGSGQNAHSCRSGIFLDGIDPGSFNAGNLADNLSNRDI